MITKVLDTNVLLDRPIEQILASLSPCKVVIPLAVLGEMDKLKGLDDSRGHCARAAIRFLDLLRPNLHKGVSLDSGHLVIVEVNHTDIQLPHFIELTKNHIKTRVLAITKGLQKTDEVCLVSQDICVRIMADVLGIPTENYVVEQVDMMNLYSGWCRLKISDSEVQYLFESGCFITDRKFMANQYLLMTDSVGECI